MTVWGGWNNHLRVGLDIWTDAINHDTTQTTLYVQTTVQCDSSWNFNDSQTVTLYVNGGTSQTWTFQNTLGANGTVTFLKTYTEYPSYGGGPSWTFQSNLTGNYLGGTSTVSEGYTLPARPIAAPSAPGAPSFSSISAQGVSVSWGYPADDGGSACDYSWLQLATSNFSGVVYDNQQSGWNGRTVTGLVPGTRYYGRDAAHNPAGWSGWSGVTSFVTDSFTCAKPTLSNVAAASATLSWASPGNGTPTGYQIQYDTDPNFGSPTTITSGTWGTSRSLTGMIPGATYYARVRANTSTGYGGWSASTSFVTNSYQLAAPTLSNVAATTATVNWGDPPTSDAASQYNLQIATDSGFTNLVSNVTAAWAKTYNVTGLTPGTTYYYRVRAYTGGGWGAFSATTSNKTLSGAKVRQAGAWKDAIAYVRVAGAWKQATVSKRVSGAWKL